MGLTTCLLARMLLNLAQQFMRLSVQRKTHGFICSLSSSLICWAGLDLWISPHYSNKPTLIFTNKTHTWFRALAMIPSAWRWAFLWTSLKCCTNIWTKNWQLQPFFGIDNLFLSPSPKVALVQIEALLDSKNSKSAQASLTIWHIHHTDRPPSAREKQFRKKTNAIDVIKEIHFSINLVASATSIHRHTRTHTSLFT